MLVVPKTRLQIHTEALGAYQVQMTLHYEKAERPHPMCTVCTFIENEIRFRRQQIRRINQGKPELSRYIEGL